MTLLGAFGKHQRMDIYLSAKSNYTTCMLFLLQILVLAILLSTYTVLLSRYQAKRDHAFALLASQLGLKDKPRDSNLDDNLIIVREVEGNLDGHQIQFYDCYIPYVFRYNSAFLRNFVAPTAIFRARTAILVDGKELPQEKSFRLLSFIPVHHILEQIQTTIRA